MLFLPNVTLNLSITHVVQCINLLLSRCRVILMWLEDSTSINYWEVYNKHCYIQLTNKCSDTIWRRTLLLLHLKFTPFFFLLSSIVLSGCKSDYLGGFYFLAAFLIKHVPASFAFPFFWNIDNNLHIWKKLSFHWQLTEKHSQFIRLVKVLKKKKIKWNILPC